MVSTFPNNFLLCVQFLALTAIFIIALPLVLLLLLLTIQIYPFIIINAVKNFCPQPIFSIKFITHTLTPARYLPVFFDTDILPFPLFPFFPLYTDLQIAIAIATTIVFALENTMDIAIKFRYLIKYYFELSINYIYLNNY